jgi:hypothetical protein
MSAGSWRSLEKTGAETESPFRVQKPEVVNGVNGFGICSSLTKEKILGYCEGHGCRLGEDILVHRLYGAESEHVREQGDAVPHTCSTMNCRDDEYVKTHNASTWGNLDT